MLYGLRERWHRLRTRICHQAEEAGVPQHEPSRGSRRGGWHPWLPQLGLALAGMALLGWIASCTGLPAHQVTVARPKAPIPPASSPESLAVGARLAQQHCVRCHAEGGAGGPAAPPDLTGQAWTGHGWHHPDSLLVQMIADGVSRPTGVMPPFGTILRSEEIRTLIAFIKTFWTPEQRQFQQERTHRADVEAPLY